MTDKTHPQPPGSRLRRVVTKAGTGVHLATERARETLCGATADHDTRATTVSCFRCRTIRDLRNTNQ